MKKLRLIPLLVYLLLAGCQEIREDPPGMSVLDPDLHLELIAEEPDIVTPIGMTIDGQDALYVLESHTHSPMSDYTGPKFDRIKKGVDDNGDGKPERWLIFADSLEDGMNLAFVEDYGLYVTTKNSVLRFKDTNGDGVSDERQIILDMNKPDEVYDHAGILGLAAGPDGWLYVSRGNTGGLLWQVVGTDDSSVSGYGDGGNLFRCRMDGSEVEIVATGFWNPFDIKFIADGRLMLTDNDPDSRGPNRLIEIVPGGDYGYKSLYGGSGIHPYLAWNSELPGTLPYAAPLGEAPCALIDAGFTNFGDQYKGSILVNVWEENNIVRIPMQVEGSSISGRPEVLVQGDSLFHPVALAASSKGELYITDWMVRQYPNHSRGRIWRLSSKRKTRVLTPGTASPEINRFAVSTLSREEISRVLLGDDKFEKAIIRYQLAAAADPGWLLDLLHDEEADLRLQALLVFLHRDDPLDKATLHDLLADPDLRVRRMALIYTGIKMRQDLEKDLMETLAAGKVGPELFETFLATIRHIQPDFVKGYSERSVVNSKNIPRKLPEGFITGILKNKDIGESAKALAMPYLEKPEDHRELLLSFLAKAGDEKYQMALMKALKQNRYPEVASRFLRLAQNAGLSQQVRAMALSLLIWQPENLCGEVRPLLETGLPLIQYAAVKYLCRCTGDGTVKAPVDKWIAENTSELKNTLQASWDFCTGSAPDPPQSAEDWIAAAEKSANPAIGRMVFESIQSQCLTCHKVDGWGSTYGPDLSHIGSSKSKSQLINAILDPSLEIAPEWQSWFVTDSEGTTHYGRQIDVLTNRVELMNTDGEFDSYRKPQSYGVSNRSLMPEGLQYTMTRQEFGELVAYLMSLK